MPVDHARLTELFADAMDLDREAQRALIAGVADPELARELAAMLDADDHIVTALRTAGLKPSDVGEAFRRKTALPPDRLDIPGYRIRATLGEGGMGVVYAALEIASGRNVAIKVLHVASREASERFAAEAAIMMALDHPGIARVLGSGETDGHPYFAMELVDGKTLDRVVAPLGERLALFAQICDAMQHAHERGVVHRDLKPANLMVRRAGGVAVLDFGVARAAGSSGKTRAGDFLGTPLYMSPEQAMGRPDEIDARTDVYALGVVLFELVAGAPPYDIRGLPLPAAVRTIAVQAPRRLDDPALDAVCARALAKRREDRFASAAELGAAVRNCARSRSE